MDGDFPRPTPAKAVLRNPGKTALMWHRLRRESLLTGRPIQCVQCGGFYIEPPRFGGCPCGSYGFEVQAPPAAATG